MHASPGAKADSSVIGTATADPYKGVRCEHDSAPFGIVPAVGLLADPAVRGDQSFQSVSSRGGEAGLLGKARPRAFESPPGIVDHAPTRQRDLGPQVSQR